MNLVTIHKCGLSSMGIHLTLVDDMRVSEL